MLLAVRKVKGAAMKKSMILLCAEVALILASVSGAALAQHGGFHGGHGGFHGGFHGGAAGMQAGSGSHFYARHGFRRFRDFRGFGLFVVGGPLFWSPYYYDPAYFYPDGTLYIAPDSNYSFYCNNPVGYYPDVPSCPSGWLRVVPAEP
ncbi:hypothetical protein CAter10_2262 [Collimonas arenae]|nr:hypothetical protein CAter10_2262 [Collimonas arenae]